MMAKDRHVKKSEITRRPTPPFGECDQTAVPGGIDSVREFRGPRSRREVPLCRPDVAVQFVLDGQSDPRRQ